MQRRGLGPRTIGLVIEASAGMLKVCPELPLLGWVEGFWVLLFLILKLAQRPCHTVNSVTTF